MHKNKIPAKSALLYMLLSLFAGALSGIPAVFDKAFILTWIFPSVMYYLSLASDKKGAGLRYPWFIALLFSFGFFGVSYSFIFSLDRALLPEFDYIPAWLVLTCAWIFLSLIQALVHSVHLPVCMAAVRRTGEKYKGMVFVLLSSALYCICELVICQSAYAAPWMNMALTQTSFLPAIQIGSLFGSTGITFIIISVNALSALAVISGKANKYKRNIFAICSVCLFAANIVFGMAAANISRSVDSRSQKVRISAVQGNISSRDKWSKSLDETFEIFSKAAQSAARDGARILVMPETALPYDITQNPRADGMLFSIAEDNDVFLISGVFTRLETGELCNSTVCYGRDGERQQTVYIKRHLVPFGEFVDEDSVLFKILPFLNDLNLAEDSLYAGSDAVTFDAGGVRISSMICFDSMFSDSVAEIVKNGGEIISLSTNDSWFGGTHFLKLHLRHSVLRAVESRRYIIRSASTGISASITPDGRIVASLGEDEYGFVSSDASLRHDTTLFCRVGSWALPLLSLVVAIGVSAAGNIRRKESK